MVLGAGWGWAYQLHLLQALKRKPDLFLCERLDVKAVFQCGKSGQVERWAWSLFRRIDPAPGKAALQKHMEYREVARYIDRERI